MFAIELLMNLKPGQNFRVEKITSDHKNLLQNISDRKASAEETEAFIEMLDQGQVRAAEKVSDVWEPQTYTIDGVLNYFGTHPNVMMENGYYDKIPLKTQNYTEEMFEKGGVRYAPGSMVRKGAFIGPQTVVMNLAFVNIGANIAGKGCMIDGGARVASCAQIGENVKFGAGSGIEGILEPAGRLASIVEDHVKIGAMCELAGTRRPRPEDHSGRHAGGDRLTALRAGGAEVGLGALCAHWTFLLLTAAPPRAASCAAVSSAAPSPPPPPAAPALVACLASRSLGCGVSSCPASLHASSWAQPAR